MSLELEAPKLLVRDGEGSLHEASGADIAAAGYVSRSDLLLAIAQLRLLGLQLMRASHEIEATLDVLERSGRT